MAAVPIPGVIRYRVKHSILDDRMASLLTSFNQTLVLLQLTFIARSELFIISTHVWQCRIIGLHVEPGVGSLRKLIDLF